MQTIEGKLLGTGLSVAIVVSRFNDLISEKLLEGAKDALLRHDVSHQAVEVFRVPGAWELPLAAKELALSGKYDAIIALGAVIRGDTPHFDYVSAEMSKGLAQVGLEHRVPVVFGFLSVKKGVRKATASASASTPSTLGSVEAPERMLI